MLRIVISDGDIENVGATKNEKNVTLINENSYVELKRSMMSIGDDIADVGACMLAMVVMLMGRKGSALMKV